MGIGIVYQDRMSTKASPLLGYVELYKINILACSNVRFTLQLSNSRILANRCRARVSVPVAISEEV